MTKKTSHHGMYIVGGIALVLSGALMAAFIPDLRRYWRIRNM